MDSVKEKRIVRQNLDEGGWFDANAAESYDEATWWDGHNHRSRATDSRWEHQELLLTKRKCWILHSWSQLQGVPERYTEITEERAHEWLLKNKHFAALPEKFLQEQER